MNRAYSILDIKSVDNDLRAIEGVASTPTPDRMGDVVNPLGAKFKLPLPLLWQHDHTEPVGYVEFAQPTKDGIPFKATIAQTDEPGDLKNMLDKAWQSVKLRLVRAVSIGFNPLKYAYLSEGGVEYDEWEWLELSLVTIPAQSEALITTIKSIDHDLRVAAGVPEPEFPPQSDPAASGKSVRIVRLNQPARDRAPPFVIRTIKRIPR